MAGVRDASTDILNLSVLAIATAFPAASSEQKRMIASASFAASIALMAFDVMTSQNLPELISKISQLGSLMGLGVGLLFAQVVTPRDARSRVKYSLNFTAAIFGAIAGFYLFLQGASYYFHISPSTIFPIMMAL